MSRRYTVIFSNVAVTAQQDFFELTPAANKPIRLLALYLSQSTEIGDAQEEGLRVAIIRVPATATSGSGGTAPTPQLLDPSDAAAGFSAEVNNTTVATTSGTLVTLHAAAWNVRIPFEFIPTPEMLPEAINAQLLVVRLLTTPADSITIEGTAYVEEE